MLVENRPGERDSERESSSTRRQRTDSDVGREAKRQRYEPDDEDDRKKALKFVSTGLWHGETTLFEALTGKVLDRYLTVSEMEIRGDKWFRLSRRVWPDNRIETTFFDGTVDWDNISLCLQPGGKACTWKLVPVSNRMVIITSNADVSNVRSGKVNVDSLISLLDKNTVATTRQFHIGDRITIEHTRSVRYSECHRFLKSPAEAGPLDLEPHQELLDRIYQARAADLVAAGLLLPDHKLSNPTPHLDVYGPVPSPRPVEKETVPPSPESEKEHKVV
eukprot:comp22484_c1_seq1/m.33914 comp22484_c1_seq1/g.33914  ORF comp22484_c1_seq1/g.33914 comp22484_c1_seq1/m.33914 type:complete len:276 (-) comp22484_c1_seq1:575-1402(-)